MRSYAVVQDSTPIVDVPVTTLAPVEVAEAPIEQTVQPVAVPTNDELIAQYGWTYGPLKDSIKYIITYYPQYFTDSNREASFSYINAIGNSGHDFNNGVTIQNITFPFAYWRSNGYTETSWYRLGELCGIDYNTF